MAGSTLAGVAHAAWTQLRPASFERRRPTWHGAAYREVTERGIAPLVDIYLPDGPPPRDGYPSILLVHGGGYVIGSRSMRSLRFLASALCAEGIAVACPDYRLLFRGGRLSAQVADISTMREYWHARAPELGLDPSRVSIGGLSAGATLALLDAAQPEAMYHRVVGIYGVYDLCGLRGPGADLLRRLLTQSQDPTVWARASPQAHAAAIDAPLLLMHGTEDRLVPIAQAEALHATRPTCTEFLRFEGLRHGWLQGPPGPESEAVAAAMVRFLRG